MPELSRAQLAVYAALAVVALMLGSRWIRSGGEDASAASGALASVRDCGDGEASGSGETFESTGGDLVVHVAGAVDDPGVYRMPPGSRVTDAIDRAGGTTGDAAADAINLAAPLADGQQIQVPAKAEAAERGSRRDAPRRPDQPRHRDGRRARHDRGHRARHRRGDPRVPRPERGRLLGRRPRPGERNRADDDGGAQGAASAVGVARCVSLTRGAPRRSAGSWWGWHLRRRSAAARGSTASRRAGLGRAAALAVVLALARPRRGRAGSLPWLVLVLVVGGLGGLAVGSARLAAIDGGGSRRMRAPRWSCAGPSRRLRGRRASSRASRSTRPKAGSRSRSRAAASPSGDRVAWRVAALDASTRAPRSRSAARCVSRRLGSGRRSSARVHRSFWPPTTSRRPARSRGGFRGALDDVRRRAESALERGTRAASGGAPPRIRARTGRPHPGGCPRRLPPLGPCTRPRGLGTERDAPGDPRDAASGAGRRAAALPPRRDRAHHRDLRPGRRSGRFDPAGGRDGRRGRRRVAREQAHGEVVRAGPCGGRHPRDRSARNRRHRLAALVLRGRGPPRPRSAAHPPPRPRAEPASDARSPKARR